MIKVGVFGSCESRDLFNSMLNPLYKNFFKIEISCLRSSLISIMQNPYYINPKLIEFPLNDNSRMVRFDFIKSDFEKTFFNELNSKKIDCLIIDNFFEARFGVGYFDGVLLTNNTWDLIETEFYKNVNNVIEFSMDKNESEYMKLFSENCNSFFEFMESNHPNIKIIVNKARLSHIVRKNDSSFYINENYAIYAKKYNKILEKLDSYIENNFNVEVLEFDFQNCYCRHDHPWGIGPNHYNPFYYSYMTKQLLDIVSPNRTFDYLIGKNQEYLTKLNKINNEFSSKTIDDNYYGEKNNLMYDYSFLNQTLCEEIIKKYNKLCD